MLSKLTDLDNFFMRRVVPVISSQITCTLDVCVCVCVCVCV